MKNLFLITLFLASSLSIASDGLGIVSTVSGTPGVAFVLHQKGKIENVKVGDTIYLGDKILVEVGTEISFKYLSNDNEFKINGGSQVKFGPQTIELVSGMMWIKRASEDRPFKVLTTNSFVQPADGEFIVSYDQSNSRTHVLSLRGSAKFGNNLVEEIYTEVHSGKFSLLDQHLTDGSPRMPTTIGEDSFQNIVSSFKNLDTPSLFDTPKNTLPKRNIASVGSSHNKIIFLNTKEKNSKRSIASVGEESAFDYYVNNLKNTPKAKVQKKTQPKTHVAPITIYGHQTSAIVRKKQKRNIASVKIEKPTPKTKAKPISKPTQNTRSVSSIDSSFQNDFERSLNVETQNQKRHADERLDLIRELRSVESQYSATY